jgi:ribosomal protein S27AE
MNEKVKKALKTCPRCGKQYIGHPALSREDNKTEICPDCGTEEARLGMVRPLKQAPELSAATKHVLYYLLRDAMREGGELEEIFNSLFVDDAEAPLEGESLQLWEQVQKEVALFSGWCFQGIPPTMRGRQ